ncbi:phosphatidylserine decarboxylase [Robertmurraya kyonggiensis]|uniref:phosphatidylserine decarboxylase n=1 Tax=Robertmurraya kyonggiensis TaxID=1037680 RepID=A0A4U1DDB9_9BACI|nr:phosphatidylserine decarboxylase [Robertmurraya kyonggiensis]TKC19993.1 phosphatidylserine decarboxylase [Robertmurraya kyonggiensis]
MIQTLYRTLIELTNGKWSSVLLSKFAQSKASRFLVPSFAKVYKINLDEMASPIHEFPTLHDFFIRKLHINAREIDKAENSVVSPVDAVLEDIGEINAELALNVKGKPYSLLDMFGSEEKAQQYEKGMYILLYLSPSHYHRIHSPLSGKIVRTWTLGNKSYPVNRYGLKYGRDTISKNFRKITEVQHENGVAAIVKVGAMFVNSIETIHNGERIEKGEEMAYFTFGSTVILLFSKNSFEPLNFATPKEMKVGEPLGYTTNIPS